MKTIFFPPSLPAGSPVAIISPAGSVTPEQLSQGIELIKKHGYEPVLGKHVFDQYNYGYSCAGTEKQRIHDLNWALSDPVIKAVWASRGGYGCQHLLPEIRMKGFKQNPKWYIGYSDNTVLQSYLLKQGFASIHGQTIKTSSFGVTADSYQHIFDILSGTLPQYTFPADPRNRAGEVTGVLIGGNLALVYALLGTRYSFKFRNRVLFIEDIGENFYALDRMLMALDAGGVFDEISALVVGGMTNIGNEKENAQYGESFDAFAYDLIRHRIEAYDFPVYFGFPNGHIHHNLPLIIGSTVQLTSAQENVELTFI